MKIRAAPVPLHSGDQLLLCSDGLWSNLREHELAYRLSAAPLERAIPGLVGDAARAGGKTGDNVTALAVTWLDDQQEPGESSLMTDGLLRDWPVVAAGIHKHYGYAFQWFALSALTVTLYAWFQIIRPRRRAARQP